jgi:ADP-ribosylglycohydrolase
LERRRVAQTSLPADYAERVYSGALGKSLGVYLGRPFEGWSYERIMAQLGEIDYYVHEKVGVPLLVTDDDIAGTFTFLRALPDYGNDIGITPAQIGQTWLNYIVENRAILWWGGLGNSTEHTAFLRLKRGIEAPRSGAMELNGQVVAEQIGAQIFIDGWAMVAPGRPELAAELARRAGTVSHDGEAVYAAQALAAMEAQAFVESDIDLLLDTGLSVIPADCIIATMVRDIRGWHASEPDWRKARELLAAKYGYDIYGGNCHVIPNHGLIVLALLYGAGEWDRSMMIVNTCGWDTDCNSGNLGCLLGLRNGLSGFDSDRDWRGPVADRIYLPTADGGRSITDIATEAVHIANIGRALVGEPPSRPKDGARFHFELPGSVQGFHVERGSADLENVEGHSSDGDRSLAIRPSSGSAAVEVSTPTFIPPEAMEMPGYQLLASPTLYSGQRVRAVLSADAGNDHDTVCRLTIRHYDGNDELVAIDGPAMALRPGAVGEVTWSVPDTAGQPIQSVGLVLESGASTPGSVYLDQLSWQGEPDVTLTKPDDGGTMWRRAWVDGLDQFSPRWHEAYRLIQNDGRGLLIHGTGEWRDYEVTATFTPHMAEAFGLAARVQGLRRYYALVVRNTGRVELVKSLDGERVLAESSLNWELGRTYTLTVQVRGSRVQASVDGQSLFDVEDQQRPLDGGGIALICDEGRVGCDYVRAQPAAQR